MPDDGASPIEQTLDLDRARWKGSQMTRDLTGPRDGLDGPEADQGHDGGQRRNENGRKSNSLEIPEEAVSGETNDVSEDEETGLGTGRVRNRARHRSYSIRGETGDVTDGRIVV